MLLTDSKAGTDREPRVEYRQVGNCDMLLSAWSSSRTVDSHVSSTSPSVQAVKVRTETSMPVDLASYILSASPPGFEFYARSAEKMLTAKRQQACIMSQTPAPVSPAVSCVDPKTPTSCSVILSSSPIVASSPSPPSAPSPQSLCKKCVVFADEVGLALVSVRLMTERSSSPPCLPSHLTEIDDEHLSGISLPPLVLHFAQPASDYLVFREKLEQNIVSLENVCVDHYSLVGTIKVKNVCYEKKVFVRVTFDCWESSNDIEAEYVQQLVRTSPYDTFAFRLEVPEHLQSHERVQFCICFLASTREYWDSNEHQNYTVGLSSCAVPPKSVPLDATAMIWSQYRAWTNEDNLSPYW